MTNSVAKKQMVIKLEVKFKSRTKDLQRNELPVADTLPFPGLSIRCPRDSGRRFIDTDEGSDRNARDEDTPGASQKRHIKRTLRYFTVTNGTRGHIS